MLSKGLTSAGDVGTVSQTVDQSQIQWANIKTALGNSLMLAYPAITMR